MSDADLMNASDLVDDAPEPEGQESPRPKRTKAASATVAGIDVAALQAVVGTMMAEFFAAKKKSEREDDEDPKMPTVEDEISAMRRALATQPRFTITIPVEQLADGNETVWALPQINGYTYPILRGEPVDVPESFYLDLVGAGLVPPQRQQDRALRPERPPRPLKPDDPSTYISRQVADRAYAAQDVAARNSLAAHTVHVP